MSSGRTLAKLARQTGVYTLGNVLLKASGLVLALFTLDPAYLSQASFGRLALLDATARVAVPLFGLGLANGLLKFWGGPDDRAERAALSFTALAGVAVLGLAAFGLVWALAVPLADVLLGGEEYALAVRLIGAYIGFKVLATTPTTYLRNHERVWLHVLATTLEMVLLVGGAYYALVVRGTGLTGLLWAYVASAGTSVLLLAGGMAVRLPWRLRPEALRRLVTFGAPLALAGVGVVLLSLGDRYLLEGLTDLETVAVYDWAARLGSVLYLVLVSSFSTAFSVLGVKDLNRNEDSTLHRRAFRHYVIWSGWAMLGLSLLAYDVTRWVSPNPAFLEVETLVLPLALGFVLYGAYYIFVNVLYAAGRTTTIARNLLAATAANVALNVVLIPAFGAMGAAAATVSAYAGLLAVTARTVVSATGVRYDWGVLAKQITLVAGLYALGHLSVDWNFMPRLAWRAGLIAAYVPLIVGFRLYRWDEVRDGLTYLRSMVHRTHR